MVDPKQFRFLVIRPALEEIGLWSQSAENLVIGTASQESGLRYIHQLENGPAKGFFQMEPDTHDDIWRNWLEYREDIRISILDLSLLTNPNEIPDPDQMVHNLRYAAAMCRVHYRRKPGSLPAEDDVEGMAEYWKEHYNTHLGAGEPEEFVENYALVAM